MCKGTGCFDHPGRARYGLDGANRGPPRRDVCRTDGRSSPDPETLIAPQHPYTRLLIESLPAVTEKKPLRGIPGLAPQLLNLPSGCAFHPRCPHSFDRCIAETPELRSTEQGRWAACHLIT
ncbi:MAG: oligopeptide/dipeptide ABC transporter ATP-binding protein [Caldilineaceae bacterium]